MTVRADPLGPSVDQYLVAPDDNNDLPSIPLGLIFKTAGTLRAKGANSAAYVDYPSFPAGTILPIRASRVYATGTSATVIALA